MNTPRLALIFILLFFYSCQPGGESPDKEELLRQAEALKDIGVEQYHAGNFQKADSAFKRAVPLAKVGGDLKLVGKCYNNLFLVHFNLNNYDVGVLYADSAIATLTELGDNEFLGGTYANMARRYKKANAYNLAAEYVRMAIPLLENSDNAISLGKSYSLFGNLLRSMYRPTESLEYHQKAIALFEQEGDTMQLAAGYQNQGLTYSEEEDWERALASFRKAIDLKLAYGSIKNLGKNYTSLGEVEMHIHNFKEAERHLRLSIDLRKRTEDELGMASSSIILGNLFLKQGRGDSVLAVINRIEPIVKSIDQTLLSSNFHELKGQYYRLEENLVGALAEMDKIILLNRLLVNEQNLALTDRALDEIRLNQATANKDRIIEQKERELKLEKRITEQQYIAIGLALLLAVSILVLYLQKRKDNKRVEHLLREYHHRNKNNFDALSGTLEIEMRKLEFKTASQDRFAKQEEGQSSSTTKSIALEMLRQQQSRIKAMALVHEQLYDAPKKELGAVKLDQYLRKLVTQLDLLYSSVPEREQNSEEINLELDLEKIQFDADKASRLGLVCFEAIANAYKYGLQHDKDPTLKIGLHKVDSSRKKNPSEMFSITIADNGPGLSPSDRSINDRNPMGMLLMKELTKELGGEFEVRSEEGTTVLIRF